MSDLDAVTAIRMVDQLFVHALSAFPEQLRATRPRPEEWSALEVLAHDWAIEARYLAQLRAAVAREALTMEPSRGGLQPETAIEWAELIRQYLAMRDEEIALLTSVPPAEWGRTWTHWTYGDIDFHWLARRMQQHTMDGARSVSRR